MQSPNLIYIFSLLLILMCFCTCVCMLSSIHRYYLVHFCNYHNNQDTAVQHHKDSSCYAYKNHTCITPTPLVTLSLVQLFKMVYCRVKKPKISFFKDKCSKFINFIYISFKLPILLQMSADI